VIWCNELIYIHISIYTIAIITAKVIGTPEGVPKVLAVFLLLLRLQVVQVTHHTAHLAAQKLAGEGGRRGNIF